MSAQEAVQKTLNEAFIQARMRNPSFSLRAFARKLDLSPAAVSEILNGKRRVSKKLAERIATNLGLDPLRAKDLLDRFDREKAAPAASPVLKPGTEQKRLELSMDHFRSIADWYHFAILSLAETKTFRNDPEWIALRLGVRVHDVKAALERLERLGMLTRSETGKLQPSGSAYTSPDEMVNLALRKAHFQNLEIARRSLEEDSVEDKDFTAITMAIDVKKIPVAKQLIRKFRDELCAFLETDEQSEVYKLCIQLLPLTKNRSEEEEVFVREQELAREKERESSEESATLS